MLYTVDALSQLASAWKQLIALHRMYSWRRSPLQLTRLCGQKQPTCIKCSTTPIEVQIPASTHTLGIGCATLL